MNHVQPRATQHHHAHQRRRGLLWSCAVLALFLPTIATATLMPPLGMERLAELADVVVVGHVAGVVSHLTESNRVVTDVAISVQEILQGELDATAQPLHLEVRVPGGELGDGTRVIVEGAPQFEPGTEAVLFLRRAGSGYALVGLEQGAWRVYRHASGADEVIPGTSRAGESTTAPLASRHAHAGAARAWTLAGLRQALAGTRSPQKAKRRAPRGALPAVHPLPEAPSTTPKL